MVALFTAPFVLVVFQLPPIIVNAAEAAPDSTSTSGLAIDPDVANGASLISSSNALGVGPVLGGMDPFSELVDESMEEMLAIDEDAPEESPSAQQQKLTMPPLPEV